MVDARWFTRDDLPELPGRLSIARKLIDDWLRLGLRAISSATISPSRMKACGSMSVIHARTALSGTPSVLVTASWIAFRTARLLLVRAAGQHVDLDHRHSGSPWIGRPLC